MEQDKYSLGKSVFPHSAVICMKCVRHPQPFLSAQSFSGERLIVHHNRKTQGTRGEKKTSLLSGERGAAGDETVGDRRGDFGGLRALSGLILQLLLFRLWK